MYKIKWITSRIENTECHCPRQKSENRVAVLPKSKSNKTVKAGEYTKKYFLHKGPPTVIGAFVNKTQKMPEIFV